MFYYDWTMIILVPAILFTFVAQAMVKGSFDKYSRIRNAQNMTGQEAARKMLDANGLSDVRIQRVAGKLTDHYNPKNRTLGLSETVYDVSSVAAVGVACHEVGHAIQHAEGYQPLVLRNSIVPVVNIASVLSWPMAIAGILLLSYNGQIGNLVFTIAVLAFCGVIAFHLVTLPVELNASGRALRQIMDLGLLTREEKSGAQKVLRAAAMTYIAALATAVANLIRILVLKNSRD